MQGRALSVHTTLQEPCVPLSRNFPSFWDFIKCAFITSLVTVLLLGNQPDLSPLYCLSRLEVGLEVLTSSSLFGLSDEKLSPERSYLEALTTS